MIICKKPNPFEARNVYERKERPEMAAFRREIAGFLGPMKE